jgi:hypothetical protein
MSERISELNHPDPFRIPHSSDVLKPISANRVTSTIQCGICGMRCSKENANSINPPRCMYHNKRERRDGDRLETSRRRTTCKICGLSNKSKELRCIRCGGYL